jgi:excisionase family DNA binding protein
MDALLSAQEAAERLGVSFWTVYRLARRGQLASVRIGRRRLFAAVDLEELIRTARRVGIAVGTTREAGGKS